MFYDTTHRNILLGFIQIGTAACKKSSEKNLQKSLLNRAWSLGMLTDPYLAPHVAAGMLDALGLQTPEVRGVPINTSNGPVSQGLHSSTHAFPSVTFTELRSLVRNMFTKAGKSASEQKEIEGIIHAYGYAHPIIIHDMHRLATGNLHGSLVESLCAWVPGQDVSQYWALYRATFPGATDTLCNNMAHVLVASTIVEQIFSKSRTMTHQNQSNSSVQGTMNYAVNVKQAGTSMQRYSSTEGPQRELRSKTSRLEYLHFIIPWAARVQSQINDQDVQSCRSMESDGKRKQDIRDNMPYVLKEFAASEITPQKGYKIAELQQISQEMTDTYLTGSTTLPSTAAAAAAAAKAAATKASLTGFAALAVQSRWTADTIRKYLRSQDKIRYKNISKVLIKPKSPEDTAYKDLRTLLVEHWTSINITEAEVTQIDLTIL